MEVSIINMIKKMIITIWAIKKNCLLRTIYTSASSAHGMSHVPFAILFEAIAMTTNDWSAR